MDAGKTLDKLIKMLDSELIRERREGIKIAQDMLRKNQHRMKVRNLLAAITQKDKIGTIKTIARDVLNEDEARHISPSTKNPDYVFGARCPKGHVSYFDKREYCRKKDTGMWRVVRQADKEVDEVLVKCKICSEEFYVEVKCEGYK